MLYKEMVEKEERRVSAHGVRVRGVFYCKLPYILGHIVLFFVQFA